MSKDRQVRDQKAAFVEQLLQRTRAGKVHWTKKIARPAVHYYCATIGKHSRLILGWKPNDHLELFVVMGMGTTIISGLGCLKDLWDSIAVTDPVNSMTPEQELHIVSAASHMLNHGLH
jgi:hypothetical protein